ncbi:hypothetical protein DP115_05170 [Brasilonema octagenarum UFV-OR1]|uniref:Uncharacterized protein n=2 Tax=Octagenarum group TaxID=3398494 RepID=A0ABX1M5T4_9CYAN|nr:hypothetical protein [Brasilonema octagenarum UFV-OR1]
MINTKNSINQHFWKPRKQVYLTSLSLIIIAFISIFYPRIISAAGVPKVINFAHFLLVPFALIVAITKTRTKDSKQIATTWEIITACFIFLGVMLASALLNKAGAINVFLDFMILCEPFLMLLTIVCIPLTPASFQKLRAWLLGSALINLLVALIQKPLIEMGKISVAQYTPQDAVQGVFYLSGAGNYISCSVSLAVGLYYLLNAKTVSIWLRAFWLLLAFWQLLISDSKQVLIVFVVAWMLLVFFKYNDFGKALMYIIIFTLFIIGFYWCMENLEIEGLEAFKYWFSRTELYGPDGEAVRTKMAAVPMIVSYYKSPLNWLFGLGPGHTVGRLGGWFFRDYWSLLGPLGATTHPVSTEVWDKVYASWLAKESSMFMPLFSWLGVWGDLGFLGLGAYLYLGYVLWSRVCVDDFCKFLTLTLFVFGLIFTQMEEAGQTLTVAILISLQWHERRLARQAHQHPLNNV